MTSSLRGYSFWVIALVVWGALSFGAVYPWGYWSVSAFAAALGVWGVVATRAWRDRHARIAALSLAALAAALVLQALPLPRSFYLLVNPAADATLRQSDVQYILHPPLWHALAVLPDNTWTVLAIVLAFALFFIGLTAAMPRLRLDRLVVAIIAFGVLMAAFGVAQKAADVRSLDNDNWQLVYGFWKPRQGGHVFGPFINRNHFAGWMVMALSLALGYSCAVIESSGPRRRRGPADWARWAVRPEASQFMTMAVAVLAMGAALTVSGSRSGIGAFAVAVAATGYFVARRVGKGRARRLVFAYLGCLLVGAILWAGVGATAGRFALVSTDAVSRIGAWRDTLRIIGDFPIVGTGVGSFARAMLVYQTGDREVFFAEAHNDYLQTIAEGGLLVAIPVIICLVALVRAARARVAAGQDSPIVFWLRAGAIAGLLGIAAQEMLDFSLQLPGVLVLFAVLAAIAVHRPPKAPEHARRV